MAIETTAGDLERFSKGDDGRPVVILQLLRFNEGGLERYLEYANAAQPILLRMGADIIYAGEFLETLVPPTGQSWDGVLLVRYPSRAAYVDMHADPAYQAIAPLRRSALQEAAVVRIDDWFAP